MLEIIITEAFFFYLGLLSRTFHDSQDSTREGGGYLFVTPYAIGEKLFWAKDLWGGYSKWEDQ